MTVKNKQLANQVTFNDAFLSRKNDSGTVGKITLGNTDLESGDEIVNLQRAINELFDADGTNGEGDAARKDYASNNYVADGDSRKVAIEKLDARAKINTDNISTNTSNIAALQLNNSADVSLGAVGSSPNANAATLLGQVLSLQPANETYAGVVSALFQKLSGVKEFQSSVAVLSGDDASTGSNKILEHNSKSVLRMTGATLSSVAGIGNTVDPIANGLLLLVNVTGVDVNILNLDGTAGAKGINTGTGANLSLPNNQSLLLWYDSVSSIYRVISGAGGSGGGISNVVTKTASGTLTLNDDCVIIDASGGNINLTLPAVVSKAIMRFKRIDSVETNTVTITCAGSDTMDGEATATIPFQYATLVIIGIGTTTWGKF